MVSLGAEVKLRPGNADRGRQGSGASRVDVDSPARPSVCLRALQECVLFFWPFFNGRTYAIRAGLLDGLGLGLPIPGTQVYGCGARIEIGAQYYSRWEITPGWDESVKDAVVDTRNAAVKDTAIPVTRC
ncbi:hypothetical protein CEP52_000271 [Fusarium oligoseptatum]|uniref:Uncharacterized protein n=1 Tax=Fusarium oligoseptatum TaxID=2604345 RepID=A0A428UQH0_9HYPO|nr:hypothetical protein CEP52_000271 [Fusarium oligoseptatum]